MTQLEQTQVLQILRLFYLRQPGQDPDPGPRWVLDRSVVQCRFFRVPGQALGSAANRFKWAFVFPLTARICLPIYPHPWARRDPRPVGTGVGYLEGKYYWAKEENDKECSWGYWCVCWLRGEAFRGLKSLWFHSVYINMWFKSDLPLSA